MRLRKREGAGAGMQPRAIAQGVVTLPDGHCRAVLEVRGVAVATIGEEAQEELLAGFAAFLNGLAFPVQLLVRAVPLDLDPYLRALEGRAAAGVSGRLRLVARDHAAMLGRLALDRTLLERRGYVVVPADDERAGRPAFWPFRRRHDRDTSEGARTQFAARCDEVILGLGRCNLQARRLDDPELARLFYACWRPEGARVQRLGAGLDAWTALAVRAATAREAAERERSDL